MSFAMMFTSSLTLARSTGSEGGGNRGVVSGKYSSRNSRMAMDCRMMMGDEPSAGVIVNVGTVAHGFVAVYSAENCSFIGSEM